MTKDKKKNRLVKCARMRCMRKEKRRQRRESERKKEKEIERERKGAKDEKISKK